MYVYENKLYFIFFIFLGGGLIVKLLKRTSTFENIDLSSGDFLKKIFLLFCVLNKLHTIIFSKKSLSRENVYCNALYYYHYFNVVRSATYSNDKIEHSKENENICQPGTAWARKCNRFDIWINLIIILAILNWCDHYVQMVLTIIILSCRHLLCPFGF